MDDAKKQLIDGLNEDLRGEFQAVIMYRLYASMVQGPYRQELRTFFANEIPEELTHAQILAAADDVRRNRLAVVQIGLRDDLAVGTHVQDERRPCLA